MNRTLQTILSRSPGSLRFLPQNVPTDANRTIWRLKHSLTNKTRPARSIAHASDQNTSSALGRVGLLSAAPCSTVASGAVDNPLVSASVTGSVKEAVELKWTDGRSTNYPYLWLRDNCYCPLCKKLGRDVFQRDFLMAQLGPDAAPKDLKITDNGEVQITWNDDHVSLFSYDWLLENGFTAEKRTEREHNLALPLIPWNHKAMQDNVPQVKFNDLLNDDGALYKWITTLEQIGICLITDVPCQVGQLSRIAEKVAFLKKTNYGENFAVKSKVDPSNLAYTPVQLGMHTDLPYYSNPPGMQMLHCIAQVKTKGGENEFTDAFYVAQLMEKEYPEHYKTLCTVPVDFADIGTDFYQFYKMSRHNTFSFHDNGQIKQVIYNNPARAVKLTIPVEKVQDLYRALKKYNDLLYSEECHITLKMRPGDCICFHNNRVMHGRTGYQAMEAGERELEGGYLDWDELRSKRRILQQKLGITAQG